ncbi:MAG: hypothetical protein ISR65_03420 [Bacteriovoracaceae bacterium]|nr:hypothetical protein [Bacteriovoracaceae bacterium]
MPNQAVALSNNCYSLTPAESHSSWSQFTRKLGSATSIISAIPVGKFLEVFDNKFNGDSLIVFRRRDFDNLNMLSNMSSTVSRCLMQIDKMTTTYENAKNPTDVISLIHEQARMAIEFTVIPTTTSTDEYFSTFLSEGEEDSGDEVTFPSSRKDIEG